MKDCTWYQIQFLNVHRVYEDCFEESFKHIDEAISMLKKKRAIYSNSYRIVERKTTERILSDRELES